MRKEEIELDKLIPSPARRIYTALAMMFLFGLVFLLWGKPVPYGNEFPYLLRIIKEAQPEFLLNDWTFSTPAKEHWLFNRFFLFPSIVSSVETLGWLGRTAVWLLTLGMLLKIGRLWQIPLWSVTAAIVFWLLLGQSMVGDEWVLGTFEAKTVSYFFLFAAIYYFARREDVLPAVCLGLTFAFHPAVGLWSSLAIGLALLAEKTDFRTLGKIVAVTGIFASFGILPLIFEQFASQPDSAEAWRFMVLVRLPYHFDPFYFSRSAVVLLLAMMALNFAVFRRNAGFAMRFLLKFQIVLLIFFLSAFVLRWFEMYELLRFLPVRLFPVFTPLFFGFSVFYLFTQRERTRLKFSSVLLIVLILARLNPVGLSFAAINHTYRLWTRTPDDFETTSHWIAANTPKNVIVIQPPYRREVWYLSQRACVASYAYQTFGRLDEWRERVSDLTGDAKIKNSEEAYQTVETAFNNLSPEQIGNLRAKYKATYLVSRGEYPFRIVFRTETYKIYLLAEK